MTLTSSSAAAAAAGGSMPLAGFWYDLNSSMLGWEISDAELHLLHAEMMANLSHSVNDPAFDVLRSPVWRGLVITLYIVVIFVGLVGNVIVICVVIRNRSMQNVTNILIANLSLSDIGLCAFSLPVQLHYQLTDTWIFGEFLCRTMFSAFAVPMYVSTLTILLIAYDRYWLIVYPLKERMTVKKSILWILIMDATSILLSTPVMCFTYLHRVREPDLHIHRNYCVEEWPDSTARKFYSSAMFVFQFCLPLVITATLYYKIFQRLRKRPMTRCTNDRKQKTNKILIAIVALFIGCWMPWNMFSLLTEIDHDIVRGRHYKLMDLILKVFALSSSCINPFLYCWLNDNFRKELDHMAVKLNMYRQPAKRGQDQPIYQPQPTIQGTDMPRTATASCATEDPFGTITMTMERFSSFQAPDLLDTCSVCEVSHSV